MISSTAFILPFGGADCATYDVLAYGILTVFLMKNSTRLHERHKSAIYVRKGSKIRMDLKDNENVDVLGNIYLSMSVRRFLITTFCSREESSGLILCFIKHVYEGTKYTNFVTYPSSRKTHFQSIHRENGVCSWDVLCLKRLIITSS
jgi:hypothetical protein